MGAGPRATGVKDLGSGVGHRWAGDGLEEVELGCWSLGLGRLGWFGLWFGLRGVDGLQRSKVVGRAAKGQNGGGFLRLSLHRISFSRGGLKAWSWPPS